MRTIYSITFIFALCRPGNVLGFLTCVDCSATISPAPTESPAPSPSPSNVPTDTQRPSVSLYPSVSPTPAPTTSQPTNAPSDVPTESPAPSPSPSDVPTMPPSESPSTSFMPSVSFQPSASSPPSPAPSRRPSGAPSTHPTTSTPSYQPSLSPTISPQPSISKSPSGAALFMISPDNEVKFVGLNALLDQAAKGDFEDIALEYLSNSVTSLQEYEVNFESVRITNQFLADDVSEAGENGPKLRVVFDVAAFVILEEDAAFNYNKFVKRFFDHQAALDVFSILLQNASDHFGSDTKLVLSTSVSAPDESTSSTEKSSTLFIASFAGGFLVVVGLATAYWLRRRGKKELLAIEPALSSCEYIDDQITLTMMPTETYDTGSYDHEDGQSEMISPTHGYIHPNLFSETSKVTRRDLDYQGRGLQPSRSVDTDVQSLESSSMFRPAFLNTESNIEIPITPMTNIDLSQISPNSVEVEEFEAWVPSPSNIEKDDDDADAFLVNGRQTEQSAWEPARMFGFGMKSTGNPKTGEQTEERSTDSRAKSTQASETCLPMGASSSDSKNNPKSSDIITFSSLFSGPSQILMNVWNEPGNTKTTSSPQELFAPNEILASNSWEEFQQPQPVPIIDESPI